MGHVYIWIAMRGAEFRDLIQEYVLELFVVVRNDRKKLDYYKYLYILVKIK
jgi:hypothetical protein